MSDVKTKVTLVGTVLAKQGIEFVYEGEVAGCDTCKVKKACNNLQKGRKYRIVTVRTTHHRRRGADHECGCRGCTGVRPVRTAQTLAPARRRIRSGAEPRARARDLLRPSTVATMLFT